MITTPCPICSQLRETMERYPNSVCNNCLRNKSSNRSAETKKGKINRNNMIKNFIIKHTNF